MAAFITDHFLLQSPTAQILYHEFAAQMPIYDYHCHLSPRDIADNRRFDNITQIWLDCDHYKWRALRTNGIDEKFITGDTDPWEKFEKWAQTIPYCLRNPLYHWCHLELKRYFGIDNLLSPDTARSIYDHCNEMLRSEEFQCCDLLKKMSVKLICTSNDPLDTLEHHQKIKADGFDVKVYPTWRPDRALAVENIAAFNQWINKLQQAADTDITDYSSFLQALKKRHDFFHQKKCRLSDLALETVYAENTPTKQIKSIFDKIRSGKNPDYDEPAKIKSALLIELARMDHEKGWVRQLHLGALRNTNTRLLKAVGSDAGGDSIGDFNIAQPLAGYLDRLDSQNILPKTVLYHINPADNELIASLIGSFQDDSVPGKLQLGPAWWFLDTKIGIENQINVLSHLGLLSRFIGMCTDSRSFLSFPRHEYFRRLLCNILGDEIEKGLLPRDINLIGKLVEDISFNNACKYFPMEIT